MVAVLIEPYKSSAYKLLALCIWREARSESIEAKMAVASVIRNRCALAPQQGFGRTTSENILKFPSFSEGDKNADKYPMLNDPSWHDSLQAAQLATTGLSPDRSNGAVFYHDDSTAVPPHVWGYVQECAVVGRLTFYRIAPEAVT